MLRRLPAPWSSQPLITACDRMLPSTKVIPLRHERARQGNFGPTRLSPDMRDRMPVHHPMPHSSLFPPECPVVAMNRPHAIILLGGITVASGHRIFPQKLGLLHSTRVARRPGGQVSRLHRRRNSIGASRPARRVEGDGGNRYGPAKGQTIARRLLLPSDNDCPGSPRLASIHDTWRFLQRHPVVLTLFGSHRFLPTPHSRASAPWHDRAESARARPVAKHIPRQAHITTAVASADRCLDQRVAVGCSGERAFRCYGGDHGEGTTAPEEELKCPQGDSNP